MIADTKAQLHLVIADDVAVPADFNATLRQLAELGHVRAFDTMHHDAFARGQVAHDLVTGYRMAAIGERQHAAFAAGDLDLFADPVARFRMSLRNQQAMGDGVGHDVAESDVGKQLFQSLVAMLGEVSLQHRTTHDFQRRTQRVERAIEHAMAEINGVLVLQALEVVADRRTRLARDHPFQPLRRRRCRLCGDDFSGLATAKARAQRREAPIQARSYSMVADAGVNRVSEIQCG